MTAPSSTAQRWDRLRPWAGLIIGPLSWLALQQGLGTLVYRACARGGPPWGPLLGVGAILACAGSAWISWRAPRGDGRRVFIARAATGVAGALGLACVLILMSTLMVPACAR